MKWMRSINCAFWILASAGLVSCANHKPLPYGVEEQMLLPGNQRMVWAIAPTINLSGEREVDSLLQSDLVFQQMQQVHGLTVVPVNRVVEAFYSLGIDRIESPEQAYLICDLLKCDGLIVPTVTAYDPYEPPKLAASLQLFQKPGSYHRSDLINPRDLARSAAPSPTQSVAPASDVVQAVAIYDASDGSVRDRVARYAAGRSDPNGPYGEKEVLVDMDQYCGFSYHELIVKLLDNLASGTVVRPAENGAQASAIGN